jgi:hypothetical protein
MRPQAWPAPMRAGRLLRWKPRLHPRPARSGRRIGLAAPLELTATQQHAVDQFAKSLSALGDDALIDTYHQAWEDHREASAEGSDNLSKAYAKSLATEKAMRDRFPDYQSRYQLRYP